MNHRNLVSMLLLLSLVSSCAIDPCMNKESFLKSHDKLIEKVESSEKISDRAWTKYDKRFEQLITECYERHQSDLSSKEKRDFWLGSINYYQEKYGDRVYDKLNDENDLLAQRLSEELENSINASGQDILAFIQEVYGEELKETIDEVVNDIEELGEELKEILSK